MNPRSNRTRHAAASFVFALAALAMSQSASAGTMVQGTMVQGTMVQGTMVQGTELSNLTLESLGFDDIQVDGTTLLAESAGVVYGPTDLVGATWTQTVDGQGAQPFLFRVVAVEQDSSHNLMHSTKMVLPEGYDITDNSDVWLFNITFWNNEAWNPEGGLGRWENVCGSGGQGFFINGTWDENASFSQTGVTFACDRGVVSKCVRSWGYKSWMSIAHTDGFDVDLGPLHRACVRAAMADYCGDGRSWTRDDTIVDLIDTYDFNVAAAMPELQILAVEYAPNAALPYLVTTESYFSSQGATAVHHYRWPGQTETVDGVEVPVEEACGFSLFSSGSWNWALHMNTPLIAIASHEIDWPATP